MEKAAALGKKEVPSPPHEATAEVSQQPTLHIGMNLLHAHSMRSLPPFDALLAFEAVLRHGSMTLAAAELGVTQSAVSHRLRRLEAFTGTPLFLRLRSGLFPTAAGSALGEGLTEVLAGMANLRARCHAAVPPRRLQVGVGAAVAQHWLVRRLPAFMKVHPEIDIELVLLPTCDAVKAAGLDVRLLWLPLAQARASSTQSLFPRETVFPVCRPGLLQEAHTCDGTEILRHLPLLHKEQDGGVDPEPEWSWRTWFADLGYELPKPWGLRLNSIGPVIGSALEGAGVALCRSLLCSDAMADRGLVRVLSPDRDRPCSKVQVATWKATHVGDDRVRTFVRWIIGAAEESVAASLSPRSAQRGSGSLVGSAETE